MTTAPTPCYNGMEAIERRLAMPENKTPEERRQERFLYLRNYRSEHYARVEINIPPELRDAIYERAAAEGISRTQLIVKALTAYMEQDG